MLLIEVNTLLLLDIGVPVKTSLYEQFLIQTENDRVCN